MAASDPSPYVATPTGTLQGVAAFSWDGSAWQPTGRAGPDVATATGVLQGVAAFNGGPAWQPAGRAQPGVATPTGVLDGVAVYTWSGSAWTPPYGGPSCSTPSGVLRGVAAFNWDGSAWQPAGQARPSVPTPYGALDGVAMFGWTGSAWAAVGAPSLSLDFMAGTLDPRITFTRASTATYTDSTGTLQTAATNAPRFDYDPVTHALRGLLVEEARTNLEISSVNFGTWSLNGVTQTGASGTAPDGTNTITRLTEQAVTGFHYITNNPTLVASTSYTVSIFAKSVQTRYLQLTLDNGTSDGGYATFDVQAGTVSQAAAALGAGVVGTATVQAVGGGIYRCSMTTTIGASTTGRLLLLLSNVPAPGAYPQYTGNAANSLLIWGVQLEAGAFATSYVPTTAAAVTRAIEVCQTPTAPWFTPSAYSLSFEFDVPVVNSTYGGISDAAFGNNTSYFNNSGYAMPGGGTAIGSALIAGAVSKQCVAVVGGGASRISNNGGAIAISTAATQSGATRLAIGNDPWSLGSAFNGHIRRVRYWPRVLSDAELQAVTT